MTPRIKSNSKPLPSIVSNSQRASSIDKTMVAKSIGAEDSQEIEIDPKGSPFALFALRQELSKRLRSTGGRRSLEGVSRRQKIPLSEEDWKRLQKLAEVSQSEGVHPTPAQVASVLLLQALNELEQEIR